MQIWTCTHRTSEIDLVPCNFKSYLFLIDSPCLNMHFVQSLLRLLRDRLLPLKALTYQAIHLRLDSNLIVRAHCTWIPDIHFSVHERFNIDDLQDGTNINCMATITNHGIHFTNDLHLMPCKWARTLTEWTSIRNAKCTKGIRQISYQTDYINMRQC